MPRPLAAVAILGDMPNRSLRRRVAVLALASASFAAVGSVARAGTQDGAPCTSTRKVAVSTSGGSRTKLICTKEGSKKIWRVMGVDGGASDAGGKSGAKPGGTKGGKVTIDKGPLLTVAPFRAEALDCSDHGPSDIPASCFRPYGYTFSKPTGESKTLPSHQYILAPGTEVYAVTDADLVFVEAQPETNDYEVLLIVFTNDRNAVWKIAYDHLDEVSVKAGDKVKAGQKIGVKRTYSDFELQVNQIRDQHSSKGNFYVCPQLLGNPAFKAFHDAALQKSNAAFPGLAVASTCLKPSIAEADYRG